jgi:hypothetical protein
MGITAVHQTRGMEDSAKSFMARLQDIDGNNIQQADVTSISLTITDLTAGTTSTPAVAKANVIFDALQTGDEWTTDATGYNFRHDVSHTEFPSSDRYYLLEYAFDMVAADVDFTIAFRHQVIKVSRS